MNSKTVVVTGATSGIGQSTARVFEECGARVVWVAVDGDAVDRLSTAELHQITEKKFAWRCDVSNAAHVDALAEAVVSKCGAIDAWVNCAGVLLVQKFNETQQPDWDRVLRINLGGYYNGCRAAVRHMTRVHSGSIVNVSSVVDVQPIAGLSAYATTKGAIVSLTKTLAVELGPVGIRVNAVAPGAVDTPLNSKAYTDAVRARYRERIPVERIGNAREIAWPIAFLCSDLASYINGCELLVDGGLVLNGNVGHAG